MLKTMRKQGGFTLIEVVAAAALIGIMATMLLPSLSGANDRVKNARLQNDLVTIDQAIQLYKMDAGTVPAELTTLDSEYLGGKLEFKDAKGEQSRLSLQVPVRMSAPGAAAGNAHEGYGAMNHGAHMH